MYYSDLTIQRVREAIDLEELVGSYVKLQAAGKQKKACCPFHHEKTPSFFISPQEGFYKCFGCGESGDGIKFVMKMEGLDFQQAVAFLADRYHIPIEEAGPGSDERKELFNLYYSINSEAARFFYNAFLKSSEAQAYLAGRSFNSSVLNEFYLGYADSSYDSLYKHLKDKGFKTEHILALGLIAPSNRGTGYYDKFRNRLIFPIFSLNDKIIGFGGRALGPGGPKYLNSPESEIFHKGSNLYALNMVKKNRQFDSLVLVEGYMDVMSLYFHGYKNAVASLGTSLTEKQAALIKRYKRQVYLCYDGDEAGIRASRRAIDILAQADIRPKLILLPDGQDPDDLCKNEGAEAFKKYMDLALDPEDFELKILSSAYNLEDFKGRSDFLLRALDFLLELKSMSLKDLYIEKIARMVGVEKDSIKADLLKKEEILEKEKADKRKKANLSGNHPYFRGDDSSKSSPYQNLSPLSSSYYYGEDFSSIPDDFEQGENISLGINRGNDWALERFRLEREMVRLAFAGKFCTKMLEDRRDFLTNPGLKQLFNCIVSLRNDGIPPQIEWLKKADLSDEAGEQLAYLDEKKISFSDSQFERKAALQLLGGIENFLLRERKAEIYKLIEDMDQAHEKADLAGLFIELQDIESKLRSKGGEKR